MTRCTYLGCQDPPSKRIEPPYGVAWFGCDQHAPAMAEALGIGLAQTVSVRVVGLTEEERA